MMERKEREGKINKKLDLSIYIWLNTCIASAMKAATCPEVA